MPPTRRYAPLPHPVSRANKWTTPRARNFVLSILVFAVVSTLSTLVVFLSFPSTTPLPLLRKLAIHSGQGRAYWTRSAFCDQFQAPTTTTLATTFAPPPNSHRRPSLSGTDLLDTVHNHSLFIHQSWKTATIPDKFRAWSDSWIQKNPHFQHVLWTDEENERLVRENYAEWWELYQGFGEGIKRADFVRNLYMHQYGGVYVDLDMLALQPISKVVDFASTDLTTHSDSPSLSLPPESDRIAYIARMGSDIDFEHSLPNAFFASSHPHHPFWLLPLAFANATISINPETEAEYATGPVGVWESEKLWREQSSEASSRLIIIDSPLIFPFDWSSDWNERPTRKTCFCLAASLAFDPVKCRALFPSSVAMTFWTHSWTS